MPSFVVDLVAEDPKNDEFVVYLVEEGPWILPLQGRLKALQERLYNSFDAIVDGHLAARFPESKARKIRIQVDAHDAPPPEVFDFVARFFDYIRTDLEYQQSIAESPFVEALRVVTGADMGWHFN